ncbi:MAG: DUF4268 domain-containing protein [Prevotella sp.]|nr:DUF4268 domain-containing protein [Prevotella sp.]
MELFEHFKQYKDEIAAMLNSEVEWREAKKACRFFISTDINPKKRESWPKPTIGSWKNPLYLRK